jgi:GNAT superfamily N-acetyltransferase
MPYDDFWETAMMKEVKCMRAELAERDDINALVCLRLAYLSEERGVLSDREAEAIRGNLPAYFETHMNRDLFVYVIRRNGEIAACAFLLVIEKPMSPSFPNGRTGTVLNVYTCPKYRKKGYADTILKALLEDAVKKQLSVIELKSTDEGCALYQSNGFADDRSGYHFMKWVNPGIHDL